MKSLATGFLCLCVVAGFASTTFADVLTPYDITGCVSGEGVESNILFHNTSGVTVDIYWIDYYGNEAPYGTLGAGATLLQQTYVNHYWIARRNSDHAALEGFKSLNPSPWGAPVPDDAFINGPGPFPRLCSPIATESTTWGGIKSLYRD